MCRYRPFGIAGPWMTLKCALRPGASANNKGVLMKAFFVVQIEPTFI